MFYPLFESYFLKRFNVSTVYFLDSKLGLELSRISGGCWDVMVSPVTVREWEKLVVGTSDPGHHQPQSRTSPESWLVTGPLLPQDRRPWVRHVRTLSLTWRDSETKGLTVILQLLGGKRTTGLLMYLDTYSHWRSPTSRDETTITDSHETLDRLRKTTPRWAYNHYVTRRLIAISFSCDTENFVLYTLI